MWTSRLRYVLLLVGLCAIATCPAAKRSCTASTRSREAEQLLDYLADRVATATLAKGHVPPDAAGPTPLPTCCEQGGTCSADPTLWTAPGWKALAFSIDGDHRYTYSYVPDPGGRSAVVRAVGDLDCDGESSLYEVQLVIDGTTVRRTWTRRDPHE